MASKLVCFYEKLTRKKDCNRILMLGLDSAGKTTMLYRLKTDQHMLSVPTLGFNVEKIVSEGNSFVIWDVGGQKKIRSLWTYYYENCQGLIYVVDSSDRVRLNENRCELINILKHPQMKTVPIVILANKQDIPGSMSSSVLSDHLCLREILRDHSWFIQGCCAVNGDGLVGAIAVLSGLIKQNQNTKSNTGKPKKKSKR